MIPIFLPAISLDLGNLTSKLQSATQQIVTSAKIMQLSPDSSFANPTTSFDQNQTVYVRIKTNLDESGNHSLNLRDNKSSTIAAYQLVKNGDYFTANFQTPQNSGTYSLEANITSGSSVVNIVQTMQVGDTSAQSSVKVTNKVNVNSNGDVLSQSDQNTTSTQDTNMQTPPNTQSAEPKTQGGFFSVIFKALGTFLANIF